MKIGIIGTAERAVAWEKNLGHHSIVNEVVIARGLEGIGPVDACIIIDESDTNLVTLLDAVKAGYHCFLISPLPHNLDAAERVYHASEESNVVVQFSHWPTLAPASQWMFNNVQKPRFIQIVREIAHTAFLERNQDFSYYWVDELAFCIKWMDGITHQVEVNKTQLRTEDGGAIHLFLRFDSGATANIFVTTISDRHHHRRTVSNYSCVMECDVTDQSVRIGQTNRDQHLFFQRELFDASRSAETAATQFLKAIQLKKHAPFSAFNLFRTLKVKDKINKKLTM
ncbi:MAG: hypothetical protein R3281_05870 [Balneolaceae bacterium]|nr:hypothetical protein [Balneolaceae bacterium]